MLVCGMVVYTVCPGCFVRAVRCVVRVGSVRFFVLVVCLVVLGESIVCSSRFVWFV